MKNKVIKCMIACIGEAVKANMTIKELEIYMTAARDILVTSGILEDIALIAKKPNQYYELHIAYVSRGHLIRETWLYATEAEIFIKKEDI